MASFLPVHSITSNEWAEEYNVYVDAQGGFRKGYGTTDNTFLLQNLINYCINNKKTLYCAFIYYRKAFDYVDHNNLWYKLACIDIRGKMLSIVKCMYCSVKPSFVGPTGLTHEFECTLGTRQGEGRSPFLFATYINDLEDTLHTSGVAGLTIDSLKLFLILYANDAVMLSELREDLQSRLNHLGNYCER